MRLQVLLLPSTPDDPAPFALVVDEATGTTWTPQTMEVFRQAGDSIGARGIMVFRERVTIPTPGEERLMRPSAPWPAFEEDRDEDFSGNVAHAQSPAPGE